MVLENRNNCALKQNVFLICIVCVSQSNALNRSLQTHTHTYHTYLPDLPLANK